MEDRLRSAQRPRVRIGTSGWQYRDWRDVLYPRGLAQADWLQRYADVFDTVEINNSFYQLPSSETFTRWRDTVPEGFVIAAKLSRYLTHVRRLADPAPSVKLFMKRASHLGDRLGPIVVQLPPTLAKDLDNLALLLKAFPASVQVAVEFRHPSWFSDDVEALLHQHGAALVWADRNGRLQQPDWRTARWLYLRLHGGAGAAGNYGRRVIDRYAARLDELRCDAYVYFNNDTAGNAVRNALALARRLRSAVG